MVSCSGSQDHSAEVRGGLICPVINTNLKKVSNCRRGPGNGAVPAAGRVTGRQHVRHTGQTEVHRL